MASPRSDFFLIRVNFSQNCNIVIGILETKSLKPTISRIIELFLIYFSSSENYIKYQISNQHHIELNE